MSLLMEYENHDKISRYCIKIFDYIVELNFVGLFFNFSSKNYKTLIEMKCA